MKKLLFVFAAILLGVFVFAQFEVATASPAADCETFVTDGFNSNSSINVSFTCAEAASAVYFGVCDSGPALDDFFSVVFDGQLVAYNAISGNSETVYVGSAPASAGTQTAALNSLNVAALATYSLGISTDSSAVISYLEQNCGSDFSGTSAPAVGQACSQAIPLFTTDAAPSDGTLEMRIMLGNENSREVSGLMMTWDIAEGTQVNNAVVPNVPGPRYVRVYWQADGSTDWYMLTSQYWHGGGSTADEYGVDCNAASQPSYHTSFASAVPVADVCFDLLNGCN
jgi:hypothetical protein